MKHEKKMRLAVFASGNGSNFEALVRAQRKGCFPADIVLLVCDVAGAFVVRRAQALRIPVVIIEPRSFGSRQDFESAVLVHLRQERIQAIALAGYMRIVGSVLLKAYPNKILNIHPSLLPAFKGAHAIKDAFAYGVKVTGVTVHVVDEQIDHGPIVLQKAVAVQDTDTLAVLEKRVHTVEHTVYAQAIALFSQGKVVIRNRRVYARFSRQSVKKGNRGKACLSR